MLKNSLPISALFSLCSIGMTQPLDIPDPDIPGIDIQIGESVLILDQEKVNTATAFRFRDGRIAVGEGINTRWSYDGGKTWKGAFQFGSGSATNYIEEVAPDTIQVYYEAKAEGKETVYGTFFTIRKK
jgi:hypothetical protein